jgi:hypothetical protein
MKFWKITIGLILLISDCAFGMLPPDSVEKENWQAQEILIGKVMEIKEAPDEWKQRTNYPGRIRPMYFVLKVEHIVKKSLDVKRGDMLKIYFVYHPPNPTKEERYEGPAPVRVEKGTLVIVYANPSQLGKDVLMPVIAGHSVFCIGMPLPSE